VKNIDAVFPTFNVRHESYNQSLTLLTPLDDILQL